MVTLNETDFDTTHKCSLFSRTSGDDSIGQARSYLHQMFLEAPGPWVFNFVESDYIPAGVTDVMKEADEAKVDVNLLGALPDDEYSVEGKRHLFNFQRPETGLFNRAEKYHWLLPDDQVAGALRAILLERDSLAKFDEYLVHDEDTREMFVCTHGARDACCATFGYPVFKKIRDDYAPREELNMRVWRTSHTGGHRFAPTVLDWPEGRYWARLDEGWLEAALYHKGPLEAMRTHIRGLSGLGRFEQVVDREILLREGWKWLDYNKRGQTTVEGTTHTDPVWVMNVDGGEVRIDFESPDGKDKGYFLATLTYDGLVPFGGCGKKLGMEQQYRVTTLEKVSE
jgi:hypothetical protein